jgi:Cu/Zn superoxide dismutase
VKLTTCTFAIALLCAAATASAVLPAAAADSKPIPMFARNGSGENGTVTLTQQGADVLVRVRLSHAPATMQPIHIHGGACDAPASVKWPLTNLVNGMSTTTVHGVTVAALRGHGYVVNAHKSATDMGTYVSCGSL